MPPETKAKMWKVVKGALIAGAGVAFTFFLQAVGAMDFGPYSVMVAGLASILANLIKVTLSNQNQS